MGGKSKTIGLSAACVALACFSAGCSLVFVTPPPARAVRGEPRPHLACGSSSWAPIVDSALTAYQLTGVAYAATLDDSRYDHYPISRKTDIALGAGFAALFAGSAVYGFVSTTRCRRARQGPPSNGYLPGVSSRAVENAGL